MTSEKGTSINVSSSSSKARTPEQIRNKLNELQKILVLFPPGRMGGARTSIRDQIKILYWALGELDDKELDIK